MKNAEIETIQNLRHDKGVFDIRWRVTTLCNYQCRFCIQGTPEEHLKQSEGESGQIRKEICERLVGLMEGLTRYDSLKVSLIGGEVTILSDLPEILKGLAACAFQGSIHFELTTNFSQDSDYYCRLCDAVLKCAEGKERRLSFLTSFYSAYTTEKEFSRKLRKVYAYSAGNGPAACRGDPPISFSVGIPILNETDYDSLVRMKSELEDTGICPDPIIIRNYPVHISSATMRKMQESRKKKLRVVDAVGKEFLFRDIQALGAALEGRDSFCPAGYYCDAGVRNIWVDAFGNVKRCPAIGSTMSMGSIMDGSFRLLDGPQICRSDHCSCSQFGQIGKANPALDCQEKSGIALKENRA